MQIQLNQKFSLVSRIHDGNNLSAVSCDFPFARNESFLVTFFFVIARSDVTKKVR